MSKLSPAKKNISLFEIISKLPGLTKDIPKFATALFYNYTIQPDTEISFGTFLRDAANRFPHHICLRYHHKTWTYTAFNLWVNRLAHQFTSFGIRKGDVVALLIENRPEILAIPMALAKIGAVTALINTSQRNQTLLHSFQLSNAKLILIGDELFTHFNAIAEDKSLQNIPAYSIKHPAYHPKKNSLPLFDSYAHSFFEHEPQASEHVTAKDACLYIYTSGTTGLPKASVISHGRWIKGYAAFGLVNLRLTSTDILYVPLPFYHATAMVVCWSSVIAGGASIVIKNKFSVSDFWQDIKQYRATSFAYVGEMCKYLLNAPVSPLEKNNTLKKMIGNGLRPDIWNTFKMRFGIEQIAEFYGSSEGNIAFFNVFNLDNTMGFSITEYAIVEYDAENEVPVLDKRGFHKKVKKGGTGLLLGEISKRYPYDGYIENAKTEKTILRNVFKLGDAWFNTNDLVRDLGLGHTQFVDRLGDTFRWKGENVSTQEVESIINQFENVAECMVYGVEIPNYNGKAGMANLILKDNVAAEFNLEHFYQLLAKQLPAYAIPVFLRFSSTVEKTDTFKHKKHTLKKQAFQSAEIKDKLFVLQQKKYLPLTIYLVELINEGKVKL